MVEVLFETVPCLPVGRRQVEYVERKGTGHPDGICDAVMEEISVALSRAYLEATGRVLHHNTDKGLLVAGQTTPQLGGGQVTTPMRLVVGDRATSCFGQTRIPVQEIVEQTVRHWFTRHLRFVDPDKHLVIQNELRPGSSELVGIFTRPQMVANDTSAVVGFAPLTETEHLVYAAERFLNSADFKHQFPETGEDVKVMGVRRGRRLNLTVALAFVDRYFWEEQTYYHRKEAVRAALEAYLQSKLRVLDGAAVQLNTLDAPAAGLEGMYLTVLGTSAESGDGGQVGRGNRANGLISLNRPMTMEAGAGKNPFSHVGKIYNVLAREVAQRIYDDQEAVEEVYVWFCSQIGRPLEDPWLTSVQLVLAPDASIGDVSRRIETIIGEELAGLHDFSLRLARGEFSIC